MATHSQSEDVRGILVGFSESLSFLVVIEVYDMGLFTKRTPRYEYGFGLVLRSPIGRIIPCAEITQDCGQSENGDLI